MNSSLLELCSLITDQGAQYAHQHKQLFLEIMKETTGRAISEKQGNTIFKIFSFLNWAYANGIWSNLSNTALRRDLMEQSMNSIVLRTAYQLSEDKSDAGVALLASELDQEFQGYVQMYNKRMKELSKQGFEADENAATLCGLEWIQEYLELTDKHMNVIVPKFNIRDSNVVKIEQIAMQVNRAAKERKKGLFSRLIGSRK